MDSGRGGYRRDYDDRWWATAGSHIARGSAGGGAINQEQFARALYQGLGRTILYAQSHPVAAFTESIVTACLYNPVFDPLIDTDRAPYLAELIAVTADEAYYCRIILAALQDPDEEMDEAQLCDFAVIIARTGDAVARQALYARFAENVSCGDTTGYSQIIELDGAEGLLHVVRTFGAALRRAVNFADDFPDYLLRDLEPLLAQGTPLDADIAAFQQRTAPDAAELEASTDREQRRHLRANLATLTYAQVRQHSAAGHLLLSSRIRWGAEAPEAELLLAACDLVAATDPAVQDMLLPIFAERRFPLDHRVLLPMLYSPDQRLALRAANALGQICHPEVRALALELIATPQQRDHGLRLLVGNFVPADYHMLAALVIAEHDDNALHDLTWCVRKSFERHPAPEAAGVLEQLYERGPCGLCRQDVLAALLTLGPLPESIAAECCYDADTTIRELVR